ncbi:hypothetical protein BGZ59_002535, partial [Podila verticillata]
PVPLVSGGAEVTSTQEAASPEPNANNAKFRQPMPQSQPPAQFSGFRPQFIPGNFSARGRGPSISGSRRYLENRQEEPMKAKVLELKPKEIPAKSDTTKSLEKAIHAAPFTPSKTFTSQPSQEYNETEGEEYYGDGQEGYGGEMDGYYYDQPLYYYYYPPDPFMPPMYYDGSVPISAPMPGHSMPMAHPNGEMMMMMPPPPPPGTGPSPDDYNNYYYYQPPVYFSPHPHPPVPAPSTPVQRS